MNPGRPATRADSRLRRRVRALRTHRGIDLTIKTLVLLAGTVMVTVGSLIAPPVALLGLGLLASEFAVVHRSVARFRVQLQPLRKWFARQPKWLRTALPLVTVLSMLFVVSMVVKAL
ncbi:hypothetical protein [Nocardia sp. NBC_00511]|uniref:hypothetical protein n=1 Tax=Nocardia sp. NBC_00511 TaxID=2903591 RepID=UPI0030E59899